jgi:hypothetical protein
MRSEPQLVQSFRSILFLIGMIIDSLSFAMQNHLKEKKNGGDLPP